MPRLTSSGRRLKRNWNLCDKQLNDTLGTIWEEWEIPREADESWSTNSKSLHQKWWERRITRQQEIDASIAARAEL